MEISRPIPGSITGWPGLCFWPRLVSTFLTFFSRSIKFSLFVLVTMMICAAQPAEAQSTATRVVPATEPPAATSPAAPVEQKPEEPVAPVVLPAPASLGPQPVPDTVPDNPKILIAPGKGLTVTSADEKNSMTIRSRVQLRETFTHEKHSENSPNQFENTNEVQVRTLRLVVMGNVLVKELKYVIQLAFGAGDFEKDSASPIFDAFVEYVKLRDLNVRVGQFFVPFDRARTIREFALQMVDRQQVVRELTLDRDVGLMLSSQDLFGLGQHLGYHLFIGGGDGRNRVADLKNPYGSQRPSALFVGRLVIKPFGIFDDYDMEGDLARGKKPRLGIGVAGAYNLHSDRANSTYGATYTLGTFNYTNVAVDLLFKWYGFSLLTEYVQRTANRDTTISTLDGVPQYSRSGKGYFVQAGQMLSDKVEVTARWDDLYANDGTDPVMRDAVKESGRQAGGGLNLYLNGHAFKLQADYFYIFNRLTDEPRHAVRAQLDATF